MGEIEPYSKTEPAGRRGQWRRGFLLAAVAVLALAASLVMIPAPAEAQSTVTMVSNVNIGVQTTVLAGGSNPKYASSFTTGPADGYGLASVTLRLASLFTSPTMDVAVHRDSSGVPGQRLFALDPPATTDCEAEGALCAGAGRVGPRQRADPNNRKPY